GTFVANGCRWHDNMSNDKSAIEHPRSSTGDELFASQRDHLFEETSGKRRANPWMKDGQTLVINCDLEYGMCPDFALQMFDDACFMLLREFGNDILKEAGDCMLGNVYRLNQAFRFKDRLWCAIKFQNRVILLHNISPLIGL